MSGVQGSSILGPFPNTGEARSLPLIEKKGAGVLGIFNELSNSLAMCKLNPVAQCIASYRLVPIDTAAHFCKNHVGE